MRQPLHFGATRPNFPTMFQGTKNTSNASNIPTPSNEPIRSYASGSSERAALESAVSTLKANSHEFRSIVDGVAVDGEHQVTIPVPHHRAHTLATAHHAGPKVIDSAIESCLKNKAEWASAPFQARAAVFLKAAELVAGPYRYTMNAATMLSQSKSVQQAEIDAACELIDFLRFNVAFAEQLLGMQPRSSGNEWNRLDPRPLDGFVAAICPFNFTAIACNLPTAPALLGNTVVWKPTTQAALPAMIFMDILKQAGLPDGVINLVLSDGQPFGDAVTQHRALGGIHFTGSTQTFKFLWKSVANHIEHYETYPRLVGETGGKDFVFAHPSADLPSLRTALLRGAFEYQGQKCSAASRAYIPQSLWDPVTSWLREEMPKITMGNITEDLNLYCGAVIDQRAFHRIKEAIDGVSSDPSAEILAGGQCDDTEGFFIEPTLIAVKDPKHRLMREEIFGPVLTLYCYPDQQWEQTVALCEQTSPYALTGAIFAQERSIVEWMSQKLRFAAGNFYINDKPTGAVVGQQPFGGGRLSGTNDKAGSPLNLLRWMSPRTIKENFVPPTNWHYPHEGP